MLFLISQLTCRQTDDVGVVESPSSNEYFLAGKHLSLSYERLWSIAVSSIDRCFVDDAQKAIYKQNLDDWAKNIGQSWLRDSSVFQ